MGIKEIMEEVIPCGKGKPSKKPLIAETTSFPTISQQEVKKHHVKPSGLGELSPDMEKTDSLISSSEEELESQMF